MSNAEESQIRDEILQDSQKKYIIADLYRIAYRFAKAVGVDVQQADRKKQSKGR